MNKRKVNERDGTCPVRTQTWCQNTDLDGVEATVLPGKLQQRHQCLQQEGGSTCLQNETSLGDKHATLTVEDKDKCKCATRQQSWAAGFHVACLPKVWVLLTVGKHSECETCYCIIIVWVWELKDTSQLACQPEQVLQLHKGPNPNCLLLCLLVVLL